MIKKHFESFHFIFISITILITILYLVLIRGGHSYFVNKSTTFELDLAILLSLFCFTLLIPMGIIAYRLMRPKLLLLEIVYDISEKDFADVYRKRKRRELEEKLQPVFDIIRSSSLKGDVQTSRDAFEKMNERFGKMIRRTEDELLSEQIAKTLSQRMLEIGLFANKEKKIELTMEVFVLFKRFLEDFGEGQRRASATILYSNVESLREDFERRYPQNLYPTQWLEVNELFIECRSTVASIVT